MIGKKWYYKGQEISTISANYTVGITAIDWINSQSSSGKTNIGGYHGVKSSPTFLRGRQITIEGGIDANTRADTLEGMFYLRTLFALEPINSSTGQFVEFKVTDEMDLTRTIPVKIEKPLEFDEGERDSYDGTVRKRRIVLRADDARFFSTLLQQNSGVEGTYGGFLYEGLYGPWDEYTNAVQCLGLWLEASPAKITLVATGTLNTRLKVINVTTGGVFHIDLDTTYPAGTVVVIDSKERTVKINGADKTGLRRLGSIRPAVRGLTEFVIYDLEGGGSSSDFNITAQFYDVMI